MLYDPARPIAVFLGPSLEHEVATSILPANYYPPVRLGDVYRLLASGVRMIVIIDGVFHATTPVWQREILAALRKNIIVVGASSMGALRAAEVSRFGMIGRGTIFEWYRDGLIDGDDEVALLHADESMGFIPCSEPLVNIRHNLRRAQERGLISEQQARELVDEAKQLPFGERSYNTMLESQSCLRWPEDVRHRLSQFLTRDAVNLKRRDAIDVLEFCARQVRGKTSELREARVENRTSDEPFAPDFVSAENLWRGVLFDGCLLRAETVLRQINEDTGFLSESWNESSSRFFLSLWMKDERISVRGEYTAQFLRKWQTQHVKGGLTAWLRANGLTKDEFHEEVAQRAAIEWVLLSDPDELGIHFSEHRRCVNALEKWYSSVQSASSSTHVKAAPDYLREAAKGSYIARWADANGVACPEETIIQFVDSWERSQGIDCRATWLRSHGLAEAAYLRIWSQRALYNWIVENGPTYFGYEAWSFDLCVLRELQVTGRLAALAESAEEKVH